MPIDSALGTTAPTAAAAPPAGAAPTDAGAFDAWTGNSDSPEGAAVAPAKEPAPEPAAPVEQPKAPEKPDEAEQPVEEKDAPAKEEAKPDEEGKTAAPEAPVVEFVADEPFETFTEKVDKFFDAYDVDPSIVAMKTGYEKQIEALAAQVSGQVEISENIRAAVDAVEAVDGYRKHDVTGIHVPKTNELLAFIQATKPPAVFKQLFEDAIEAPSQKYAHLGLNMLHEYFIDVGVPPQKLDELVKYVSGEATPPPLHPDLPEGVPQEVGEAYGRNSALRKLIDETAETLSWSEADRLAYPEQYKEAKTQFDDAVAALKSQQNEINKERSDKVAAHQKAIDDRNTFNNTVLAGTQEIQKAELGNFSKDLGGKLAEFIADAGARDLQVLAYSQLIVNALSDDIYGADARTVLKAQGINIEFSKAQTLFQQIQDAVAQRQIIFQQTGDEKAASKAVEKQLTNALRELGIMRRNVIGKVAQVVTKSYTNGSLKPPTAKPALRPALKGGREAAVKSTPKVNWLNEREAGKAYFDVFSGQLNT
jgi:hypothetical protein